MILLEGDMTRPNEPFGDSLGSSKILALFRHIDTRLV